VRDLVRMCNRAYSKAEILQMEGIMLNALEFSLTVPSPLRFAERLHKVSSLHWFDSLANMRINDMYRWFGLTGFWFNWFDWL
jgi:hypothetical protein